MNHARTGVEPAEVLRQVTALVPTWAERAGRADDEGRIAAETAAEIRAIGAHRLLQPARYGGAESGFVDHVRVVSTAAEGCAATGWCLAIWSVHNWMLAHFDPAAQEEIWGPDPDVLISASIVARAPFRAEGAGAATGLQVGGRFPFGSGSDHAGWYGVGGIEEPGDGPVDRVIAMVPGRDVTVDHASWNVMGLRGTGSKDLVVAAGVIAPRHRILSMTAAVRGEAPGQSAHRSGLYATPFREAAILVLAPPALGVARAALARFVQRLDTHRVGLPPRLQREDPAALLRVTEASAEIHAAELVLLDAAAKLDAWGRAAVGANPAGPTAVERAALVRDSAFAVRLCATAVDRLYEASGGAALQHEEPLQRQWRDVHAIRAHAVLGWDNSANEYMAAMGSAAR